MFLAKLDVTCFVGLCSSLPELTKTVMGKLIKSLSSP